MVGYKVGQCLRTHRLVGMSCPSRFPVYERNLRETGNVSQQSQCDDKLLFIRVMSPRCSWHCLCHTHICAESLRWSDTERYVCKCPVNGVKRKRKCIFKHIFSSLDTYTYIQGHTWLFELLIFSQRSLGLCLYHPSRK